MEKHQHTKAALNRLSRAIGRMNAIQKMLEGGRDCSEILIQLSAVRAEITNEHYPKSIAAGAPAVTIAVKATYIADATLSEDAVYAMTKALWENREAIASAHNTGKAMDIKTALLGIGAAPVHAGAMRYYEEYLASQNTANGTSLSFKDFYGYTK